MNLTEKFSVLQEVLLFRYSQNHCRSCKFHWKKIPPSMEGGTCWEDFEDHAAQTAIKRMIVTNTIKHPQVDSASDFCFSFCSLYFSPNKTNGTENGKIDIAKRNLRPSIFVISLSSNLFLSWFIEFFLVFGLCLVI